jgi:hypothetical protein
MATTRFVWIVIMFVKSWVGQHPTNMLKKQTVHTVVAEHCRVVGKPSWFTDKAKEQWSVNKTAIQMYHTHFRETNVPYSLELNWGEILGRPQASSPKEYSQTNVPYSLGPNRGVSLGHLQASSPQSHEERIRSRPCPRRVIQPPMIRTHTHTHTVSSSQ